MAERPTPVTDDATLMNPTPEARASFGRAFERIVGIMARLRSESGCPWDKAQDLLTLRAYLIEEAYEVLDAVEQGSVEAHREELGDLLLQVVFHAELRREEGLFDAADVAHGIADKLVRRHPHVFEGKTADGAAQAFEHWEIAKAKEKAGRSVIDGVPRQAPGLLRAQRIGEKASRVGFDWPKGQVEGPLAKLDEEMSELRAAIGRRDAAQIESELGDVLFTLVNVARFLDVNAEDALSATIARFSERFKWIEAKLKATGRSMKDTPAQELDQLWNEAKAKG
jgi:MazG family protein